MVQCTTAPGLLYKVAIQILFCLRFEPRTLMFALGLTFEPMDRFQSVLHLNCLEFSVQFNGVMCNSPRVSYKNYDQNLIWSEIRTWDLDVCLSSNF